MIFGFLFKKKKRGKASLPRRRKALKKLRKVSAHKIATKKKSLPKVSAVRFKRKKLQVKKNLSSEELTGRVTHYFPKIHVAAVKISRSSLQNGDLVHFKGYTSDFEQKITSMQVNHEPVIRVSQGDEVGILVRQRVRRKDKLYRVKR